MADKEPGSLMSLLAELRERRVFRVAAAYAILAWLLLQLADVTFAPLRFPLWAMNVLMIALAIGFPVALIIAWAFQVTPGGLVLDAHREKRPMARSSKIELAAIGVFSIVTVVFAVLSVRLVTETPEVIAIEEQGGRPTLSSSIVARSIGVLPFDSFTDDEDNRYFGDGIAEELLNRLAQVRDLRVAARTSSFYFRDRQADITDIANKLAVRHVLEGSVRRQGEYVRVTAQLIDAETGYHLWSQNYNRRLEDIFAIQDDIAVSIVRAMKNILPDEAQAPSLTRRGTESFEAYDLHLQARHQLLQWTPKAIDRAIELLSRAVIIDDRYAAAHADLALARLMTISQDWEYGDLGYDPSERSEIVAPLATASIDRAAELNERLPEVQVALGVYRMRIGDDILAAVEAIQAATEIDPNNADAYYWLGELHLFKTFNNYESMLALERAFSLDPLNPQVIDRLSGALYRMGYLHESIRLLKRLVDIHPDYPDAQCHIAAFNTDILGADNHAAIWSQIRTATLANPASQICIIAISFYLEWLGQEDLLERWRETVARVTGEENVRSWWMEFDRICEQKDYPRLVEFAEARLSAMDERPANEGMDLFYKGFVGAAAAANTAAGNHHRASELFKHLTGPPWFGPSSELDAYVAYAMSSRLAGNEKGAEKALRDAQTVAAKWQQRGLLEAEDFVLGVASLRLAEGSKDEAFRLAQSMVDEVGFSRVKAFLNWNGLYTAFMKPLFDLEEWREMEEFWETREREARALALADTSVTGFFDEYDIHYAAYLENPAEDHYIHERVW